MDLTINTPAEIDTYIAKYEQQRQAAIITIESAQASIDRIDSVQGTYEADFAWNSQEKRAEFVEKIKFAKVSLVVSQQRLGELQDEFTRRGGWNRFYLVTNTGGHVHSSMNCETCFITTEYFWLTEQSGMEHDALVDLAGEQACTVCFPNAPVDTLRRKSRLEAPERKAARLEREAKAAAKKASEIEVVGLVEQNFRTKEIRTFSKTFKSARAVTNEIASNLSSLHIFNHSHPDADVWRSNITAMREALTAKGIEYDYDKANAAAAKKAARG